MPTSPTAEPEIKTGHLESLDLYSALQEKHPELARLIEENRALIKYALTHGEKRQKPVTNMPDKTEIGEAFYKWIEIKENRIIFDSLKEEVKFLILSQVHARVSCASGGMEWAISAGNHFDNILQKYIWKRYHRHTDIHYALKKAWLEEESWEISAEGVKEIKKILGIK